MQPLFDHPDFQCWNKPAGMSTHNEKPSLQDKLQKLRPGPVHFLNRLDADTSGLVVTIKNAGKVQQYQRLWQATETTKIYLGLHRRPRNFQMQNQVWTWPLSDQAEGAQNPQGPTEKWVPCQTRFFPLLESEHLVFSALVLETGRQHQIRKHSLIAGSELIGDRRYGNKKYNAKLKEHTPDLRLGLHCWAIRWTVDTKPLTIETEIPLWMSQIFPDSQSRVAIFFSCLSQA